MFGSTQMKRCVAAATLVAALAASVGSVPAAWADPAPVAIGPTFAAPASVVTSVTADATLTALPATPTVTPTATTTVTPTVTPRPTKKLTVRQVIAKVGREAGLRQAEIDALLWIAKRESNYHPTSVSRGGCYGLFQLSRGMASGHPWKDPAWNTKRAIKYMRGRYGGVLKAKAFWLRHHWY